MKVCYKCKIEKEDSEFCQSELKKYSSLCKACTKEKSKKYREKNKERISKYKKRYYNENRDFFLEKQKAYYVENKEDKKEYQKKYNNENKEKVVENKKRYYNENRDFFLEKQKAYYVENKEKVIKYQNEHYNKKIKEDPNFRIKKNISSSIRKNLLSKKSSKNNETILKYLPYSMSELKIHLESQFEDWMNWSNYGSYKMNGWDDNDKSTWTWQIDHIIPHSYFKYLSMKDEEFIACWSLNNLRPYPSKQNLLDGNRRIS